METGRKLVQTKKRPLGSNHETMKVRFLPICSVFSSSFFVYATFFGFSSYIFFNLFTVILSRFWGINLWYCIKPIWLNPSVVGLTISSPNHPGVPLGDYLSLFLVFPFLGGFMDSPQYPLGT